MLYLTFFKSTYYGKYPGGGACALDPPSPVNSQPGWIMVAAGQYDYQKSVGCGMCIEITANGEQTSPETGGPTPMKGTYKAYIVDLCGGCNQGLFVSCMKQYPKEQSLHCSKNFTDSESFLFILCCFWRREGGERMTSWLNSEVSIDSLK